VPAVNRRYRALIRKGKRKTVAIVAIARETSGRLHLGLVPLAQSRPGRVAAATGLRGLARVKPGRQGSSAKPEGPAAGAAGPAK